MYIWLYWKIIPSGFLHFLVSQKTLIKPKCHKSFPCFPSWKMFLYTNKRQRETEKKQQQQLTGMNDRFHMALTPTLTSSVHYNVLLEELICSRVQPGQRGFLQSIKSTLDRIACQRWWVSQRVLSQMWRKLSAQEGRALRMLNMVITWHGTAGNYREYI